ncbi:MAG: phosphoribosylanthranilate isomerase [Burkholderiaceae bacterium]
MIDPATRVARTRVKYCGFVREQDVHFAAGLGVDAIGLVFYEKSPRLLTLDDAAALRQRWPSWVAAVGLFVNAAPQQVREHTRRLGLDVVQFHGDETPQVVAASLAPGQPYWRAVRMRSADDLLTSRVSFADAECFLLDADSAGYGGSGRRFDWTLIPPGHASRLIVSGGLGVQSVGLAIETLRPVGVDVSTGIQGSNVREKDPDKMAAFMAEVLDADASLRVRTP